MKLGAVTSVAVTLSATAVTPEVGVPPAPAVGSRYTPPGPSGPAPRVSSRRAGRVPVKASPPAVRSEPSVNQPPMSTRTSADGAEPAIETVPPAPTAAITRLGTVWPALKLRFEL